MNWESERDMAKDVEENEEHTNKRDDEIALWRRFRTNEDESLIDCAEALEIPYKRAKYIAEKWIRKGYYECGVSWRVGWVIDDEYCYGNGAEKKRKMDKLAGIHD